MRSDFNHISIWFQNTPRNFSKTNKRYVVIEEWCLWSRKNLSWAARAHHRTPYNGVIELLWELRKSYVFFMIFICMVIKKKKRKISVHSRSENNPTGQTSQANQISASALSSSQILKDETHHRQERVCYAQVATVISKIMTDTLRVVVFCW